MASTPVKLTNSDLAALSQRGLKLWGLAQARNLAASSRIEGPTSILAVAAPGAFLDIGAFCNLSGGTINNLQAGRYCSIAQGAVIGSHEHPTDWLTTSRTSYFPQVNGWDELMLGPAASALRARTRPFPSACPITTLGPDVWIGQGAFVRAGVTVGAGAIVGARTTVLRDVPAYAIVVGTPGRVVRLRFAEPIVERLLALGWWDYSIYDLFDVPFDDIERALDLLEPLLSSAAVAPYAGPVIEAGELSEPKALIDRLMVAPLARAS